MEGVWRGGALTRYPSPLFTWTPLSHFDYHVGPHRWRPTPAHPPAERGAAFIPQRTRTRQFKAGPGRLGQDSIRPRCAPSSDLMSLHSNTCLGDRPFSIPGPDDTRCRHSALAPFLPKIAHRHPQPRPPCASACALLHPPAHTPQALFLPLFCVLARCL